MKDLFGLEIDQASKCVLFHDESDCKKSNFLYHGFLFIRNKNGRDVLDKIKEIKKNHNKEKREIHFNELNQHSKSPNGAKTSIALEWLNSTKKWFEKGKIMFYCFGVDKNNVKNFWTNPNSYEKNIYLRFFEIGMKAAIRWFSLDKITHTFLDNGKHDEDRQKRVRWLNFDFFNSKFSHEIDPKNIKSLSSDENKSNSEFSNFIQLADVLLGTVRSSFCELSGSQKGQKECVENFIDVIERFNDKKKAYNNHSRYWKKFCIQFFPSPNNLMKEEFLSGDINSIIKRGNFYCDRKTYRQRIAEEKNLKLNF
jgi:hypothetical protein